MGAVRERVLVAMSGGVDSSVAAALLVEAGHEVIGATMKLFCYGDAVPDRPCCSLDSIADAQLVAHKLDIPQDRKSTRLNSSHLVISYAVFCLKKKKKTTLLHLRS